MIVVTGATGHLGRLVIEELLKTEEPKTIIAAVRDPRKASDLADRGVEVREADYAKPDTLLSAFDGAERLLLISGNEMGKRVAQHKAAIDAAKTAGVTFVAYTSLLHCDTSPLSLTEEHLATERYLQASGLIYALLRNGWYFENQTAAILPSIEHGAVIGASGAGRFAAAARADYAAAAAIVLRTQSDANSILELAGDSSYTRADLAAEISKQTGKDIGYQDLPEAEFEKILNTFLPAEAAHAVADAESKAAEGALDDTSHTLSRMLGRPTTSLAEAVSSALKDIPGAH